MLHVAVECSGKPWFLYLEPGADKSRREQGVRVGGGQEGIGDYSQPIDGVATETRKSVSPSFVCWWSLFCALALSLFMSVSVERYSSSCQLWEKQRFTTNALDCAVSEHSSAEEVSG